MIVFMMMTSRVIPVLAAWAAGVFVFSAVAAELPKAGQNAANALAGELAIKQFKVAPGLRVDLWAAEPLLANPVAFAPDAQGRWYVAETFRLHAGVTDIRGHMNWLEQELASTSLESWMAIFKGDPKIDLKKLSEQTDRVKLVWDSTGSGRADASSVFAEGFNEPQAGIGSGVLAHRGSIYYTCIPDLWLLKDTKNTGTADVKKSLARGFGVRTAFLGHDLHGLRIGPDGRLYFSIGDRGANATALDGRKVYNPETGAIYRCNLDGTGLEIFAHGLRNPQELAFDEFGNLFTGDNNSDAGDPARWVYAVEGGDSGWRIGWQFINQPNARGPWLAERLCYPQFEGQAAHHLPPIAILGNGPSGLTYHPGTGLVPSLKGHFLLANFSGSPANSGILAVTVKPKGASFEMSTPTKPIWNTLVTDVEFGPDGALYVVDWVNGWGLPGKGRIYRLHDPALAGDLLTAETKQLLATGMTKRGEKELASLLAHADQRVRTEAQFELVDRAIDSLRKNSYPPRARAGMEALAGIAQKNSSQLARLHAIWGLGQIARMIPAATVDLLPLLADKDAEVRAQAAKVLGDAKSAKAAADLVKLLADESPRVRSFAAIAIGKLGHTPAVPALFTMLRANDDKDPVLRHAAVMGLVGCADATTLAAAAKDNSRAARIGAVVALRRLSNPAVVQFLNDADPLVVAEAARAINDESIEAALPALAALAAQAETLAAFPEGTKEKPGPRDAVLRRVLNANLRVGKPENAVALAKFAGINVASESRRSEALQHLSDWASPIKLDRVSGLYRPLTARDAKPAADALRPVIAALVQDAPNAVRAAALRLVEQFGMKEVALDLAGIVANTQNDSAVRVAALKAMAARGDAKLAEAVKIAAADKSESLRKEATRQQTTIKPANATATLVAALGKGTTGEKQNALVTLGDLKDAGADVVLAEQLDLLLTANLAPELQLDLIEAAAKRMAPAVKERLAKFEASLDLRVKKDPLAKHRVALAGGNAEAGKKIFFERIEASCLRCHQVDGEGGEVGPVLTGIATRQNREHLLESIVNPNAKISPGFDSVVLVIKGKQSVAGILKSETPELITLNSPEDGIVKVKKADVTKREKGLSGMPAELANVLSKRDLRDLIEFLGSLK